MKKPTPVIISDNDKIKNILVQVDLNGQKTTVLSSFSAWDNLALLMEALAVTAQRCIDEGIPKKQVDKAISSYLADALGSYLVR